MKRFIFLISLVLLTSFTGLFNQVFMADSALYACIAKTFVLSGDYLNIYVDGQDWLDKPHFSFWMEALSMELFGIHSIAFKLPSFLFFLLGMAYTFLLAQKLYSREVALLAVLIFGSCIHIVISNNDIKVDAILTGLIIAGTYHLYELTHSSRWRDILLAGLFMAAAIMTKGVFTVLIFASAIPGYLLVKGNLRTFFHYKWILVFLLTCLFIGPELYALYTQFDMHPEKVVFGRQGVSGIQFFFWGSQFGRFSGTGPITIGTGSPLFYLHTFLWAFGPWSVIAYAALIERAKSLRPDGRQLEFLTFFGFLVMFIVFSVSSTQLAHYTNIIFPFISILTADFIVNRMHSRIHRGVFLISLLLFAAAVPALMVLISVVFIQKIQFTMIFLSLPAVLAFTYIVLRRARSMDVVAGSVVSICCLMLFLNTCFYPELHRYQAGSQAAFYTNEHFGRSSNIAYKHNWLFEFYSGNDALGLNSINDLAGAFDPGEPIIVFADDALLAEIQQENIPDEEIRQFEDFRTSMITWKFFHHKTRASVLKKTHLLRIKAQ